MSTLRFSKKAVDKLDEKLSVHEIAKLRESVQFLSTVSMDDLLRSTKTHKLRLQGRTAVYSFRVNHTLRLLFSVDPDKDIVFVHDIVDIRKI